jgi:hypothetical protein
MLTNSNKRLWFLYLDKLAELGVVVTTPPPRECLPGNHSTWSYPGWYGKVPIVVDPQLPSKVLVKESHTYRTMFILCVKHKYSRSIQVQATLI